MVIVKNNRAFENVSKICLSNSMYALEDGVSTHQSISKIALNVNSLQTLKNGIGGCCRGNETDVETGRSPQRNVWGRKGKADETEYVQGCIRIRD